MLDGLLPAHFPHDFHDHIRRSFALLPGYIKMSDGPNGSRAKREDQNATLLGSGDHGWRVRGVRSQAEDYDVCPDSVQVQADRSAPGKSLCNQASIGMVVGQSLNVVIEGIQPSSGEDPDLPHCTPEHPPVSNAAPDHFFRSGKQRPAWRPKPF